MLRTLQPVIPYGIVNSMRSATWDTCFSLHQAAVDYWFGAFTRQATPFDLAQDLVTWTVRLNDRKRPPWAHEHRIVREWPIARLRDYSAPDADPEMVATVILPPQAGHDSSIVDFADGQSQVITGRQSGCHRIYSLDWVGATQETKDTSIDDYMSLLRETADMLGGKVNLVGDCQGGWLATIFAALHPEKVNTLAIAGAPIDFHVGEPLIHDWLKFLAPQGDMSFYRSAVEANDGVLPGRFLLDGFKTLQPGQEVSRSLQLLTSLHDAEYVERHRKFEDWFQWTQDLPGEFYLWVVEHLFIRNSLIKRQLVVEGRTVDLAAIDCPLFLMAGETDHITPADQVWALANHVSTPAERIGRQSASNGHLGLFMSREALRVHWSVIFEEMAALSTPTSKGTPDVLTDEPTGSEPTVWDGSAAEQPTEAQGSAEPQDVQEIEGDTEVTTAEGSAAGSASSANSESQRAPAQRPKAQTAPVEESTTAPERESRTQRTAAASNAATTTSRVTETSTEPAAPATEETGPASTSSAQKSAEKSGTSPSASQSTGTTSAPRKTPSTRGTARTSAAPSTAKTSSEEKTPEQKGSAEKTSGEPKTSTTKKSATSRSTTPSRTAKQDPAKKSPRSSTTAQSRGPKRSSSATSTPNPRSTSNSTPASDATSKDDSSETGTKGTKRTED